MRFPGRTRWGNFVTWVNTRFSFRVAILLYHRVARLDSDPQLLAVTPKNFSQHLEILHAHPILSLEQLNHGLRTGTLPRQAVVLTFDDGYADTLYQAKPLLKKYEIPATMFVTVGYGENRREFWWDELEQLLLRPGDLPPKLKLTLKGTEFSWDFGATSQYSRQDREKYCSWNVLEKGCPTPRHRAYGQLCQLLRPLPEEERLRVLSGLWQWRGASPQYRDTHAILTNREVAQLATNDLISIGSHGLTHAVLTAMPAVKQYEEIMGSKGMLEEILGCPVPGFSYPYGSREDYNRDAMSLVKEAGFDFACANFANLVHRYSCRWQLPRFLVRNWDAAEFDSRLKRWLS